MAVPARPSGSLRSTAAAFAAALLVSLQVLEGAGVHRCPAHDAGAGVELAMAAGPGHHHGGGAPQHAGHPEHASECACLGDCQAPTAVITSGPPLEVAVASRPAAVPPPADAPLAARRTAHLLPFAIGPPLTA